MDGSELVFIVMPIVIPLTLGFEPGRSYRMSATLRYSEGEGIGR